MVLDDLDTRLKPYQEKSINFSSSFALLLGVTVFFFFFIFMPYLSIFDRKDEMT